MLAGAERSLSTPCKVTGNGLWCSCFLCMGWINHFSQGNPAEGLSSKSHHHLASACKCKIIALHTLIWQHMGKNSTKNDKQNLQGLQQAANRLCFFPPVVLHMTKMFWLVISFTIKNDKSKGTPGQIPWNQCRERARTQVGHWAEEGRGPFWKDEKDSWEQRTGQSAKQGSRWPWRFYSCLLQLLS